MSEDIQPEPRPGSRRREDYQDEPPRRPRSDRRPRDEEDDYEDYEDRVRRKDDGLSTLIPYRNPMALTSYYLGVFALIPCIGLLLGPLAIIFGGLGLVNYKKNPTAGGIAHAIVGLVLGTLVLLGHLVVIVLVATGAFK